MQDLWKKKNFFFQTQISINGLISFEEEFSSFSPEQLPIKNNVGETRKLLCPYWSDLDKVDTDVGEVFYQVL